MLYSTVGDVIGTFKVDFVQRSKIIRFVITDALCVTCQSDHKLNGNFILF